MRIFRFVAEQFNRTVLLILAITLFLSSVLFSFLTLESDSYTASLFGSGFGDTMAWAQSARIKYLYGVWHRGDMDDWRPIFMVPLHSILTYLGYSLFDLTLIGHRFIPFVLIQLSKAVVLYLVYRECGKGFFIGALLVLSVYTPLSELARIGSADSVQVGLYSIAILLWYLGVKNNKKVFIFLSGAFVAITVLYKISALLFLFFPAIYILASKTMREVWSEIVSLKSNLYISLAGILLILVPYFLFWLIPYLDEAVYFSIRMKGTSAAITNPTNLIILGNHIAELLSGENINAEFAYPYHAVWILGTLLYLAVITIIPANNRCVIDYILLSLVIVFFFQIVLFDMAFRRYLGLIPFGLIALSRGLALLKSYDSKECGEFNFVQALTFSYTFYLLVTFLFFKYIPSPISTGHLVVGLIIGFGVYLIARKFPVKTGICILAMILLYLPENYFYTKQYFSELDYGIKQTSIEMGEHLGTSRVIDGHFYSLYNEIETGYNGTHSGQYKPDGWVYDDIENLDLREFSAKKHGENFWALKLILFEKLYPGFLDRWYLPKDYKERYHSDYFAYYRKGKSYDHYLYTHYARRHLVIGMSESDVYVFEGVEFTDYDGNKRKLNIDQESSYEFMVPDSVVNRRWYGVNENNEKSIKLLKVRNDDQEI